MSLTLPAKQTSASRLRDCRPCTHVLMALLWLMLGLLGCGLAQAQDFLDPDIAFVPTAAMSDPRTLDIHYQIAPDYYMYKERFEVRIEDAEERLLFWRASTLSPEEDLRPLWQTKANFPRGTLVYDPTFEREMEVYHNSVTFRLPLQTGADGPLTVQIIGQGCADTGLCYPPMTQELRLLPTADGYEAQGEQVRAQVPPPEDQVARAAEQQAGGGTVQSSQGILQQADDARPASLGGWLDMGDRGMAGWLQEAALWQILLLGLIFGLLLTFTPCVLPMVPILLAVLSGGDQSQHSRWRGFSLAALYVFGMSLVYTVLGVLAGLLGVGLAAWLQSPWVLGTFALLLALFALAMLGVFTMQVPVSMQSALQERLQRIPGGKAGGAFVMGMLSALIVGPCVAAPLAGVLLFISQTGDVLTGGLSLFAMAWGQGLLLLAVGASSGALLPRAGAWMEPIKAGFGLLLLATAWWMARPLLPSGLYVAGWALLAIWLALMLWAATALETGEQDSGTALKPMRLLLRALALLVAGWGMAQGAGLLAGGQHDMLRPLDSFVAKVSVGSGQAGAPATDLQAIRNRFTRVADLAELNSILATTDRPVMLDFYADWCVSCLEMEKFTFSDPQVAASMAQMVLLQADVTRMNAADRELLGHFDLFGPPGIMFFDAQGRYLEDARVIGFQKAEVFGLTLNKVLQANSR